MCILVVLVMEVVIMGWRYIYSTYNRTRPGSNGAMQTQQARKDSDDTAYREITRSA